MGFDTFISLIVAGYYSSFTLAASVMLHKRLTNSGNDIPWGPFRLSHAGPAITVASILYSILVGFFSLMAHRGQARCSKHELLRASLWGSNDIQYGFLAPPWKEALRWAGNGNTELSLLGVLRNFDATSKGHSEQGPSSVGSTFDSDDSSTIIANTTAA